MTRTMQKQISVLLTSAELVIIHTAIMARLNTMEADGNFENSEHDSVMDLEARIASILEYN